MEKLTQAQKFAAITIYVRARAVGGWKHSSAQVAWELVRTHFLKRSRALWWDVATERTTCLRWGTPGVTCYRFCPLGEALGVDRMQGRARHARDTLAFLESHYAVFSEFVRHHF